MSNTDRVFVVGDVVLETKLSEGQEIQKKYTNCSPGTLADKPGKYAIVRIGDE